MKKIKVVIVDDEPNAISLLKSYFTRHFSSEILIIETFTSSRDAISYIQHNIEIDLLVLDINMPETTGVELLELFPQRTFEAIFITAYSSFAIEAFKNKALDYILKPIDRLEFIDSIKKAIERVKKYKFSEANMEYKTDRFSISINGVNQFIDFDNLIYLQADGSYTKIVTTEDNFLISKNLKNTIEDLSYKLLLKVNRSYVINQNHVVSFCKSHDGSISMSNGKEIGISRRLKKEVLIQLNS